MLKAVLRGLAAVSLAVLPLTVSTPVHAAETLSLTEAVAALPVADESREGYDRDAVRAEARIHPASAPIAPEPGPAVCIARGEGLAAAPRLVPASLPGPVNAQGHRGLLRGATGPVG
jgi:hypothetical protein